MLAAQPYPERKKTMDNHLEIALLKKNIRRLLEDNRVGNERIKQLQAEAENWKARYIEAVNDTAHIVPRALCPDCRDQCLEKATKYLQTENEKLKNTIEWIEREVEGGNTSGLKVTRIQQVLKKGK